MATPETSFNGKLFIKEESTFATPVLPVATDALKVTNANFSEVQPPRRPRREIHTGRTQTPRPLSRRRGQGTIGGLLRPAQAAGNSPDIHAILKTAIGAGAASQAGVYKYTTVEEQQSSLIAWLEIGNVQNALVGAIVDELTLRFGLDEDGVWSATLRAARFSQMEDFMSGSITDAGRLVPPEAGKAYKYGGLGNVLQVGTSTTPILVTGLEDDYLSVAPQISTADNQAVKRNLPTADYGTHPEPYNGDIGHILLGDLATPVRFLSSALTFRPGVDFAEEIVPEEPSLPSAVAARARRQVTGTLSMLAKDGDYQDLSDWRQGERPPIKIIANQDARQGIILDMPVCEITSINVNRTPDAFVQFDLGFQAVHETAGSEFSLTYK